ncbi:MAG: Fpg/Nei family DNA glycosylase [Clostridiales bacterium]|nr:Fpg/Nei family DNA glycosylase [Clostridiales bacterium]
MPELPEIRNLAVQMNEALLGSAIMLADILQPKCLNLPEDLWKARIEGRTIENVDAKGKWIRVHLTDGYELRINLGMGGEVLLHDAGEEVSVKKRALLMFADGRSISVNFWWFGSLHAIGPGEMHAPFDKLGPDILNVDETEFAAAYSCKKSPIKTLLLKQDIFCGIGNYYVHDILFAAGIHPMRPGNSLSEEEMMRLFNAVHKIFQKAILQGAADYERDLYNNLGHYSATQVGYREGEPCRVCGTAIAAERIGSANSYFCPKCQK